jgi:signal transduction histidine kinase
METSSSQIVSLTVIITTALLLFFSWIIIRYIFLYQRKRFQHRQEIIELREAFHQHLLQSKLEIQEQTLDHIAKELHANFSHLVSLININLSTILPQSSSEVKESILETKSLAKQLLSELKALSASLNTDHIMQIGFGKALENELKRLVNTKKFEVSFTKTGAEFNLPPEHEIILFRLCQEILNNVLKHARAACINVLLTYSADFFILEIADNGTGFEVDEIFKNGAEKGSTGLVNIRKRALLIKAELALESKIGLGTTYRIRIPRD